MARRIPIPALKRIVRAHFEPNEYPSSMQKLYEWTPDESIAAFYTDPGLFTSTHSEMEDLTVPKWAKDATDFIRQHRAALESGPVSLDLHHWIDTTFGYKLSGEEALANKNVVLNSEGSMPHERGIVQLFHHPHPPRIVQGPTTGHTAGGGGGGGIERMRKLEQAMAFVTDFEQKSPCYYPIPMPAVLTPAEDIFAFGCLISEMWAPEGKALFTTKTIKAYMRGEYTPNLAAGLPQDIEQQVIRMISREPKERPTADTLSRSRIFSEELKAVFSFLFRVQEASSPSEKVSRFGQGLENLKGIPMEVYLLLLPTYTYMLGQAEYRVQIISCFGLVGAKLGKNLCNQHLLRPLLAAFQTPDLQLQKALVEYEFLDMLMTRFGQKIFLSGILQLVIDNLRAKDVDLSRITLRSMVTLSYALRPGLIAEWLIPPLFKQLGKQNSSCVVACINLFALRIGEVSACSCILPRILSIISPKQNTWRKLKADTHIDALKLLQGMIRDVMKGESVLQHLVVDSNNVFRMALSPSVHPRVLPQLIETLVTLCQTIQREATQKHVLHYMHQLFQNVSDRLQELKSSENAKGGGEEKQDHHDDLDDAPSVVGSMGGSMGGVSPISDADLAAYLHGSLYVPLSNIVGRADMNHALAAGSSTFVSQILVEKFGEMGEGIGIDSIGGVPPWQASIMIDPSQPCLHDPTSTSKAFITNLTLEMGPSFADSFPLGWVDPPREGGWDLTGEVIEAYRAHQPGVGGGVRCLAVDETEAMLVSGGGDKLVKLWSLPRVQCMQTYREHRESIIAVLPLPGGRHIASCDHSVHVWDVTTGVPLLEVPASKIQGQCLHLAPESGTLLVGTAEGTIQCIDPRVPSIVCNWVIEKKPPGSLQYSTQVRSICSHESSHTVVGGLSTGVLVSLDQRYGLLRGKAVNAHETAVTSLLRYRDFIISSSHDRAGTVHLWGCGGGDESLQHKHTVGGFDQAISGLGLYREALFISSGKRIGTFEFGSSSPAAAMVPVQADKAAKGIISAFDVMQCTCMLLVGSDDGTIKTCR